MATPAENLEAAIQGVSDEIAALEHYGPGYSIEGQSVQSRLTHLRKELTELLKLRPLAADGGPSWTAISPGDC